MKALAFTSPLKKWLLVSSLGAFLSLAVFQALSIGAPYHDSDISRSALVKSNTLSEITVQHCAHKKCLAISGELASQSQIRPALIAFRTATLRLYEQNQELTAPTDQTKEKSQVYNLEYAMLDFKGLILSGELLNTKADLVVDLRNMERQL